jgi:hypothetical protein
MGAGPGLVVTPGTLAVPRAPLVPLAPLGQSSTGVRGAPRALARRATRPFVIDGRLDEPDWDLATVNERFIQQFPAEAETPSERTTFRVLYDDDALYVGITCVQVTTPVSALLTRRDRVGPGDRVTVDIATRDDGAQAAHFGVSAAGVLDDGTYFNDSSYSDTWDENWEGAASIGPTGWSAELRIPFRILRIDAASSRAPSHRWGFQVQRFVGGRKEWDLWSFRPRSSAGVVSTFGVLEGVENIGNPRPFELRPAVLARVTHRDLEARSAFAGATVWTAEPGLDARAHPTPGTTLDLAFNPDFGQVEADQVVLNLTNIETVYPEKRPFFLEGLDIFSTPRSILYTRRIGARPADPLIAAGETVVESADPSRLWASAKWVGGIGDGTNLGVLSSLAGENDVAIRRSASTVERPASPLTLFDVLRLQRRVAGQIDLGLMVTATNRREHVDGYPTEAFLCPNRVNSSDPALAAAPSVASRCTSDAYVGAVDARWRSPSADYSVTAQLVGSLLAGGPPRPSLDGIATRPGHLGTGGTLTLAKQGGRHWLATLAPTFESTELDYNDLGYLERKNDKGVYADLTYRTVEPWGPTLETDTTLALSHRQTFDAGGAGGSGGFFGGGLPLENNLRLATYATFTNFWQLALTGYLRAHHFDDRETGDGTALERAAMAGGELWFSSDDRRAAVVSLWGQWQTIRGHTQAQVSATATLHLSARLDLELSPGFGHVAGEPRFIAREPGTSVYDFGELESNNLGVTARSTLGLTTRLTLQLYGQAFLATKHYSAPSRADTGGAFRSRIALADLQPVAALPAAVANPDVQQAVLNVDLVLRWEFRLGSILYVVYARTQEPSWSPTTSDPLAPPARPALSAGALLGNRGATDTLMLKLAYWWG